MELAAFFRAFASGAAGGASPLYEELCLRAAETPAVLALAVRAPEASPMILLAAVHDELLRDPGHALAGYYPDVGGEGLGPGLWEAFTAFCAERERELTATLTARRTQTNETARCAALLPTFAAVADGRELALIEIGASAGLNLCWDRYAYDYGRATAGVPGSPLRIGCELRGDALPPLDPPPVAWRMGIDLDPADLSDPEDVRWLMACVWPDQPERRARLDAAIAVAREDPPAIRRGDALELLPAAIAEAPRDALVCVFHTATLSYFSPAKVAALRVLLAAVERDVAWIGGEAPGILVEDPRRAERQFHFALSAGPPGALTLRGRMGQHGGWLEWIDG